MHADPQTIARDMVVDLEHPIAGPTKAIGLPVKFSATPGAVLDPAPILGQHSREVLSELGFSDAEIETLAAAGDVVLGDRD